MQGSIQFDADSLRYSAPEAWFAQGRLQAARAWATSEGYLFPTARGGLWQLSVSRADWLALAATPEPDPESVERADTEHEYIAALLALGRETLRVNSDSFVHAQAMQLSLEISGAQVDFAQSDAHSCVAVSGERLVLSPLGSLLFETLLRFNTAARSGSAEQAVLIAALKRLRARADRISERGRGMAVVLDPHLDAFHVREPAHFQARWTQDDRNRVSLQLFLDDEAEPLPLGGLHDGAPVISRKHGEERELIVLDAGTAAVARAAQPLQQRRKDKLDPALLRDPLALIPEGVSTPNVDYGAYALAEFSHRVVGFEAAKRDTFGQGASSGTEWYRKDSDNPKRFVVGATRSDGARHELAFDTADEGHALASKVDAAVRSGAASVELLGAQVLPQAELAARLRAAPAAAAALDTPDGPRGEEAGAAANTSDEAPKPSALRPKLADVEGEAGADLVAGADVMGRTPWPRLASMLTPGVVLKPYQREGVAWLWHRYTEGASGALLADDMGLGKTLQIACLIALAKALPRSAKGPRPSLIVAPVILLENWKSELTKFFQCDHLPGRIRMLASEHIKGLQGANGELDLVVLRTFDVVLTSYETLARHTRSLLRMDWDVVVLDEAHKIKNQGTQVSLAARGLSGSDTAERPRKFDFGICSTGTPVENSLGDIWALYDFCSPGSPFGSYEAFRAEFGGATGDSRALAERLAVGQTQSSLLRREKESVMRELPAKREHRRAVPMTEEQRALEQNIVRNQGKKKGGALGIIQNLQALYQHPWLLDETRLHGGIEDAIAASPKLQTCLHILDEVRERGEKALVFTLWTNMQQLLKRALRHRFGLADVHILNGDPKNRKQASSNIASFSASPGFDVLVLSPLAAGAGLNIQAANHIIHYGRWWNPAKEDQATGRAYRMGQTRPVHVYYPLVHYPDSELEGFDVKLDELVHRKRELAQDFLTPADNAELTAADLMKVGAMEAAR